jgi:hypothetical protein
MVKKAFQQGRSERRGKAYSLPYVEPLSDARTKLEDFFNILLEEKPDRRGRGLIPGHVVLVNQEVDQFDAVPEGMLGLLGHGQNGADGFAGFEIFERWNTGALHFVL